MANMWSWLAVAGLGALHGLSPANGWMFAAACGVRARDAAQVKRALIPIAIGHFASVAIVAGALAQGLTMNRARFQVFAGALLVGAAAYRLFRRDGERPRLSTQAGHAGIALWSFLMATAHGTGLMLVPALVPLCLADNPAREITASGSLVLALAAFGIHTTAMLGTCGVTAAGVCRGIAIYPGLLGGTVARHVWTATLCVTGALLVVLR